VAFAQAEKGRLEGSAELFGGEPLPAVCRPPLRDRSGFREKAAIFLFGFLPAQHLRGDEGPCDDDVNEAGRLGGLWQWAEP
jgi:hypothetical protein